MCQQARCWRSRPDGATTAQRSRVRIWIGGLAHAREGGGQPDGRVWAVTFHYGDRGCVSIRFDRAVDLVDVVSVSFRVSAIAGSWQISKILVTGRMKHATLLLGT